MNKRLYTIIALSVSLLSSKAELLAQDSDTKVADILKFSDKGALDSQMLTEAGLLLDHSDPFVRAMAEWSISRKVGHDNRKDVAAWPRENTPQWFSKWFNLSLETRIEMDWCRQVISGKKHTSVKDLRTLVAEMIDRIKLQINHDTFSSLHLPEVKGYLKKMEEIHQEMIKTPELSQIRQLWLKARRLQRMAAFRNKDIDFNSLLFYTRFAPHHKNNVCGILHNGTYKPGGDITVIDGLEKVQNKRSVINGKLGSGHLHGMDLHFDGKKVVFGYGRQPVWPPTKEAHWPQPFSANWAKQLREDLGPVSIFEMNLDGTELKQLTSHHIWSDTEPIYCPNDDVVFSSERSSHSPPCDHYINDITDTNIYRYKRGNESILRLTNHRDVDMTPRLLDNGLIAYMHWEYQERHFFEIHSVWTVRPDGSNGDAYFKEHLARPLGIREVRSIPGTGKFVGIAAGHHVYSRGSIIVVDPAKGINSADAIRVFTQGPMPRERDLGKSTIPVEFGGTEDYGGLYRNPYPLSETTMLASYAYTASSTIAHNFGRRPNAQSNGFGIYLIDAFGNKELIYRDPIYCSVDVFPVKKRKRPVVFPEQRRDDKNYATCIIPDIYEGTSIKRGTIKYIRVCDALPTPLDENGRARKFAWGPKFSQMPGVTRWTSVRVIGVVPVEEDGSAHFRVPAVDNSCVYFQALDENYMEIQRMRANVSFQPGEVRSCFGCHESRNNHPPSIKQGIAASRPADIPIKPTWGYEGFDYETLVQPVLEKHCVSCHGAEAPKGGLDLTSLKVSTKKQGYYNKSYISLMGKRVLGLDEKSLVTCNNRKSDGSVTKPYQFGSHKSKFITSLLKNSTVKEHQKIKLTSDEWLRLVTWVDLNAPYHGRLINKQPDDGSMARREHWQWPDPWGKPIEVPARHKPVTIQKEYAGYIISDPKSRKIIRYDKDGNVTWELEARYCFDLQYLDNGNVLYSDGKVIREVNREKTVIWEYDCGKETHSCQRLPNGNTLVGDCGNSCLVILDRAGKKIKSIPLQIKKPGHHGVRWARKSKRGTYFVAQSDDHEVCEYNEEGEKLRTISLPSNVFSVVLHDNGDVIAGGEFGIRIIAPDNSLKWSLSNGDIPEVNVKYVLGIELLKNGNLVVANWPKPERVPGQKKKVIPKVVKLFEVDMDKKVVRQFPASANAKWISLSQQIFNRKWKQNDQ